MTYFIKIFSDYYNFEILYYFFYILLQIVIVTNGVTYFMRMYKTQVMPRIKTLQQMLKCRSTSLSLPNHNLFGFVYFGSKTSTQMVCNHNPSMCFLHLVSSCIFPDESWNNINLEKLHDKDKINIPVLEEQKYKA